VTKKRHNLSQKQTKSLILLKRRPYKHKEKEKRGQKEEESGDTEQKKSAIFQGGE
jgi:hypothetical protein